MLLGLQSRCRLALGRPHFALARRSRVVRDDSALQQLKAQSEAAVRCLATQGEGVERHKLAMLLPVDQARVSTRGSSNLYRWTLPLLARLRAALVLLLAALVVAL